MERRRSASATPVDRAFTLRLCSTPRYKRDVELRRAPAAGVDLEDPARADAPASSSKKSQRRVFSVNRVIEICQGAAELIEATLAHDRGELFAEFFHCAVDVGE